MYLSSQTKLRNHYNVFIIFLQFLQNGYCSNFSPFILSLPSKGDDNNDCLCSWELLGFEPFSDLILTLA